MSPERQLNLDETQIDDTTSNSHIYGGPQKLDNVLSSNL